MQSRNIRQTSWRAAAMMALAIIAGCHAPPSSRRTPDSEAASRGLAAIERVGCGACHEIPGLDWPKGQIATSLAGFDDVGLIAGVLPNRPGTLAAFVRNAPAVKPGTSMPPMPLTEEEAADVAVYLYGIDDD